MRNAEFGMGNSECGRWNAECGSDWNAEVGMRNAEVGKGEPQNQITANRRTEEYRMSNVEGMYSVYLIKKTERAYSGYVATKAGSHSTLLHFGTHR
jgi:hypothetical protein